MVAAEAPKCGGAALMSSSCGGLRHDTQVFQFLHSNSVYRILPFHRTAQYLTFTFLPLSIAFEILEEICDPDVVVTCCGGGGMLAGMAAGFKLAGNDTWATNIIRVGPYTLLKFSTFHITKTIIISHNPFFIRFR
jgi:hypothetical protein